MGIKGLTKFLGDHSPGAIRVQELSSLLGRVIAIDASMSLYQFMVAIRDAETFGTLTNEAGEATSHISGMLSRAVRLLEKGIKPVYVFDGKPPTLKGGELAKRSQRRAQAEVDLAGAQEAGDREEIKKFMGRTVKITKQHNEEVKTLLRLLGIPIVEAPCEAEAQCAKLCSSGKVYATATEDADALTFGSSILIRHLNVAEQSTGGGGGKQNQKQLLVITLSKVLEELGLSHDEFVDFCILCGCDYCDTIKGIGPQTAYKLIKEHKSLKAALSSLDKSKYSLPENFPHQEAKAFFMEPEVQHHDSVELKWREPDFDGLRNFLVEENSFNPTRVDNYLARLRKAKAQTSQTRLESFFGATTVKKAPSGAGKTMAKAKVGGGGAQKRRHVSSSSSRTSTVSEGVGPPSLIAAAAAAGKDGNKKRPRLAMESTGKSCTTTRTDDDEV